MKTSKVISYEKNGIQYTEKKLFTLYGKDAKDWLGLVRKGNGFPGYVRKTTRGRVVDFYEEFE